MKTVEKSHSSVAAPERDTSAQNVVTGFEAQGDCSIFGAGLQGRLAVKPKEAARLLGIGVNAVYELCHRSDFPVVRVGNSMIVPLDGLRRWLDRQAGEVV